MISRLRGHLQPNRNLGNHFSGKPVFRPVAQGANSRLPTQGWMIEEGLDPAFRKCGAIVVMADCQDVRSLVQSLADGLNVSI